MTRRVLNLGCGNDTYGDVRVDATKTKTTTHVFDLNKPFPLKSNSFDEIYCKSVLEHIKNLGIFSDECYRVLKKGGKIWIRTDYAGFLLAHIWNKHEPNRALDINYAAGSFGHSQKHNLMEDHHYMLFAKSHLKHLFGKFKQHKFSYFYAGSNFIEKFVFRIMPKKLGACHIEMEALK